MKWETRKKLEKFPRKNIAKSKEITYPFPTIDNLSFDYKLDEWVSSFENIYSPYLNYHFLFTPYPEAEETIYGGTQPIEEMQPKPKTLKEDLQDLKQEIEGLKETKL